MDFKKKMLLQEHQKDIVRDLDMIYIMDELFTNKALSSEEYDHLTTLKNRAERTRHFLDILIQNGTNKAFEVFVDSLHKDHKWLWEKLSIDDMKSLNMNDSFEDSLSRGDVPRLPDHYVKRVKLENDVAAKLQTLSRHKMLALHGMSGSGKSSIAIGVLRNNPDLITTNFNGVVFWLHVGNVKTEDDIFLMQNKLYRKATSLYTRKDSTFINSSISMSSLGSNGDCHSSTSCEQSKHEFKDTLKTLFSENMLKDALLVLDELNEKKCLEAFDIGCKLLITTRDTGVIASFHPIIVKIQNNFEETESLQLLASCLDVDVSELPRQAKKLNEICKGSPFHIALISAQLAENKERLIYDTNHWNYYIHKLAKKELFFSIRKHPDNPMKTIEYCINSLKPDILPLFKKLAIIPDNVKLSPKVMSKLWNKPIADVESIMKQLKSKSLIIEFFNKDQRNYNYEVHDIIMNFLRSCLTSEQSKRLHVEFLKSYNYDTIKNSPLDFVDDGYIPYYIGYHILNTHDMEKKWDLFKLFLNLNFLGNKVRLTGPADVIADLQKYEVYITKGSESELDRNLLIDIKAFLSTHGNDLHQYPCTDIIQSILQHECKGPLYIKALKVGQINCNHNELYFEFLHEKNVNEIKHSSIDVKQNIRAVCFLGDYVMVGTSQGNIKVFHILTNKLKKELPSDGEAVTWIAKCPSDNLIVASLNKIGVVKIMCMDDLEHDFSDHTINHTINEEVEDTVYKDGTLTPTIIQPKLGPFLNCRWANNEDTLITHTSKMIILYSIDGSVIKVIDNFDREKLINNCVPTNNDRHVLVASCVNTNHYVEVINVRTKEKIITFDEMINVNLILSVPGSDRILIINEHDVFEHQIKISNIQNAFNTYSSNKIISTKDINENLQFLTAIVNKSGSLLFISTNDSRIICIDLKTNLHIFDLDNRRGDVISMAVSEVWYDDFVPGSDVLLTGTGCMENLAKVWYLDASYVSQATQRHRKVRLTTKFDVSFVHSLSPQTPSGNTTPPSVQSESFPKRHQSFNTNTETENKRPAKKTKSLDRFSLKPLNLKGICNGSDESGVQPLLAVVDDKNNIQIIRGRKVLAEITSKSDDKITIVKISPCNQYIIIGQQSGRVQKYVLRTKEIQIITDVASTVQYLNFVNPNLLVIAGKNKCLMAFLMGLDGWKLVMLQKGDMNLGSQEILNDIQGNKKKNGQPDTLSKSGSDASISSKERLFPCSDSKSLLCKSSCLVECFWVPHIGMITVENNATIKLWTPPDINSGILNGRQTDVNVRCAAFQNNVLVICDEYGKFKTFQLMDDKSLRTTYDNILNKKILSCDLTTDGHILAMGLECGDVVIWNVPGKCQLNYLRHHKSKVQTCFFSPVPDKLYRSNSIQSQMGCFNSNSNSDDEQPPLVLVTMASEIVWWDVTYLIRIRSLNKTSWRTRANVLTPASSPLEIRNDISATLDNMTLGKPRNYFFGDANMNAHDCWESLWRKKRYKEGSERKEILACIKLSGMNAKKLCHDEKFSCFVTVDNPGHIHIMNLMKQNS